MEAYPVPWLARHGAWVWVGALVAMVLAGGLYSWLRLRRRARGDARRILGEFGTATDLAGVERAVDGVEVTVGGTLDGDGETLRVGDGLVRLTGPLDVLVGAREVHRGSKPQRLVADGDRVWIRGVVGTEASDVEGSYRSTGAQRVLSGRLRVASETPPRVALPPLHHLGLGALAGAVVFFAAFGLGGAALNRSARNAQLSTDANGGTLCFDDPPVTSTLLAAATPFHRKSALGALARFEEGSCTGTEESARRLVGYQLARGDCDAAVTTLLDRAQPARALEVARACGARAREAVALWHLGDVGAASALLEAAPSGAPESAPHPGPFTVRVHVEAGRWAPAAAAVRAWSGTITGVNDSASPPTRLLAKLQCVARALDHLAGVGGALDELRERASRDEGGGACALLLGDASPAERPSALEPLLAEVTRHDVRDAACLLLLETNRAHACAEGLAASGDSAYGFGQWGQWSDSAPWGLWAVQVGARSPAIRELAHQRMAHVDLGAGLIDDARGHLDAALDALRDVGPQKRVDDLRAMTAILEFLRGDRTRALDALRGVHTRPAERLRAIIDGTVQPIAASIAPFFVRDEATFAVALAGDGVALAAAAARRYAPDLVAVQLGATSLQRGRAELAAWLAWGAPLRLSSNEAVESLMANLGARGHLLALLEEPHGAELLRAAAAHRSALLRRDSAVILFVLDSVY